jgi:hypothetical protein
LSAPRDGNGLRHARHVIHFNTAGQAPATDGLPEWTAPRVDSLIWRAFVAVAARGRLGAGGLARRLKITRPHAAALLVELEERGAVLENYRGGRGGIYRPAVAGFPPPACL